MPVRARAAATAQRGIVEYIWGAVATVLAVVYTRLSRPAPRWSAAGYPHLATPISRLWGWLITRTSGVKVEIEGLEHLAGLRSYVLVSNHQSFFDSSRDLWLDAGGAALRGETGAGANTGSSDWRCAVRDT